MRKAALSARSPGREPSSEKRQGSAHRVGAERPHSSLGRQGSAFVNSQGLVKADISSARNLCHSQDGRGLRCRLGGGSGESLHPWPGDLDGQPALLIQSCLTLCNPVECSPPGSSIHGYLSPGKNTGVGCHCLLRTNDEEMLKNPCAWRGGARPGSRVTGGD